MKRISNLDLNSIIGGSTYCDLLASAWVNAHKAMNWKLANSINTLQHAAGCFDKNN